MLSCSRLLICKLVVGGDIVPVLPESRKMLCEHVPVLVAVSHVHICSSCLPVPTILVENRTHTSLVSPLKHNLVLSSFCSRVTLKKAPVTLPAAIFFSSEVTTFLSSEISLQQQNFLPWTCVCSSQCMIAGMIVVLFSFWRKKKKRRWQMLSSCFF